MKIDVRLLITILILFFNTTFAQPTLENIEDLKGVWVNDNDIRAISIYNKLEVVSIYDDLGADENYGSIRFKEIHFIKKGLDDKTNIKGIEAYTQNFEESSGYFITVYKDNDDHIRYTYKDWSELIYGANYFYEFDPSNGGMVIQNVKIHYYHKVKRLTKTALAMLYKRSVKDGIDYLKYYLDIEVRPIAVERSDIFDSVGIKTKMYLIKGDLITITGLQGEFLEVEYETAGGKIITGLIRKEDILTNSPSFERSGNEGLKESRL